MRTRVSTRIIVPGVFAILFCASGAAHAHFNLLMPPPLSTDMGGGKGLPPCGPLTPASNVVTKVQGGHPLTVSVIETTPHTGFYRIALAINARTELPLDNVVHDATGKVLPPSGTPAGISATADFENPPVFPVLADNLWPHQGTAVMTFTTSVTLPNVTCAKCTLQVIEFMAMHLPNQAAGGGPSGGYFYHHCADLQITADPTLPGADGGVAGGSSDAGAPDAVSPAADAGVAEVGVGSGGSVGSGGASASGGATGTGGASDLGSGGTVAVSSGGTSVTASGGSPGTGGSNSPPTTSGGAQGASSTGGAGTASSGGNSGCSLVGGPLGSSGALSALLLMATALKARKRGRG
jgi:hypothetical protein